MPPTKRSPSPPPPLPLAPVPLGPAAPLAKIATSPGGPLFATTPDSRLTSPALLACLQVGFGAANVTVETSTQP